MNPQNNQPNNPYDPRNEYQPTRPMVGGRPMPRPNSQQARPAQPSQTPRGPQLPAVEKPTKVRAGIPDFSDIDTTTGSAYGNTSHISHAKNFGSLILLFGGALLLALAINSFVFQSYQVFGKSMETTLQEGNRLIVSKLGKSVKNTFGGTYLPERGKVIVFQSPRNSRTQLVKRVIGLPGERVIVNNGSITVYNDEFPDGFNPDKDQVYADNLPRFTDGTQDVVVPEGHVFVSGDNRTGGNSLDSRNDLGTVPLEKVIGSVWMRIFPLSDARTF